MPGLGESMFVWMSKDPNGPRFTPELLGLADCFGNAGLLVGVVIFNKFLRKWKYRDLTLKEWGKKTRIHKAHSDPMVKSFSGCSWICSAEMLLDVFFSL